jgi:hypothetical protein
MAIRTAEDFYRAVRLLRETQKYCEKNPSPLARNTVRRQEADVDRFIRERDRRLADQKQEVLIGGGG